MRKLILMAVALLAAKSALAETIDIRIGAATATEHVAAFIGVERGIFAKHGLNAKIQMYQTGVEMINGLLADAQDVNLMGSIPFLAGVSRGQPLVLIGHLHGDANASSYAENVSLIAAANSGIRPDDFATLRGKRIGLPRGTGTETYVLYMAGSAGLRESDLSIINLQPGNIPAALRQGDVQAISVWEPWGSQTLARTPGSVLIRQGNCVGCYDPGTILTSRAVISKKSEQLRRFMVAFAESQQWLRENFDAAAEINMRWIPGVDLDVMKAAIRKSHYDLRLSRNTIDGYDKKAIPTLVADKRMAKSMEASTVIDAQFYKHVEATAPQFFSDLPPIPSDRRL